MSAILEPVLGLVSPWGYVVVGLLAALETASLLGIFVPGETGMVLGGVIVSLGHADLRTMIIVAALSAIAGDTVGYEMGRHFGARLRASSLGRRIPDAQWQRTEDFMHRRGGIAVMLGRFISIVRVLVPFVAGTSRMRYPRFAVFNAIGASIWAGTFVTLGYLAGHSYKTVEKAAGRASGALALAVISTLLIVAGARWLTHHQERVLAALGRARELPLVVRIETRFGRQIAFLVRRLDARRQLGLGLTVLVSAVVVLLWTFAGVTEDVVGRNELVRYDDPVSRFLIANREPWLTTLFETLTRIGSAWALGLGVVLVGCVARWLRNTWRPLLFLVFTLAGASLSSTAIKVLVARPRPNDAALVQALGYAFPSGHSTSAMAGIVAMAIVMSTLTARWWLRVTYVVVALVLALGVGISRVYLGVHAPTDVIGGWLLGGLWVAIGLLVAHLLRGRSADRALPPRS